MFRLFIFLLLFSTIEISAKKNDKKPNFLFILVDDQPYDAVGFSNRYKKASFRKVIVSSLGRTN